VGQRRSGLGRGLGALIPSDVAPQGSGTFQDLPIEAIEPNRYQPRETFDEEALATLTASIRELGVLQPVLVRPLEDDAERFELIAGERRWRAARRAGLLSIPAVVRPIEDKTALEQALVENLHRADLNPLEEAAAYQQLVEDFGLTQDQIATRVGRSRSAVANTLRLLQLPMPVQRLLVEGRLAAGHARALAGIEDPAVQVRLATQIAEDGLTVRDAEELVRRNGAVADDPAEQPAPVRSPTAVGRPLPPGPSATLRPAGLLELEHVLGDHFETKVKVSLSRQRGRITIDFADLDDLERIYRVMVGEG